MWDPELMWAGAAAELENTYTKTSPCGDPYRTKQKILSKLTNPGYGNRIESKWVFEVHQRAILMVDEVHANCELLQYGKMINDQKGGVYE